MRLPLFVYTPSIPSKSATVLVPAGEWEIELNSDDTTLNLSTSEFTSEAIKNGQKLSFNSPTPVWASIIKGGKERSLSLYLNDHISTDASE